jgi:serine/threonine protein kinase
VIGTPQYMSPEQSTGRALDHRTDLFSVGVIMYELLAGVPPFSGTNVDVVLASLAQDPPAIRMRAGVHVDPKLENIARKLMARRPGDRYQSADEALAAFATAPEPVVVYIPPPAPVVIVPPPPPPLPRRRRWPLAVALAAAAATIAVACMSTRPAQASAPVLELATTAEHAIHVAIVARVEPAPPPRLQPRSPSPSPSPTPTPSPSPSPSPSPTPTLSQALASRYVAVGQALAHTPNDDLSQRFRRIRLDAAFDNDSIRQAALVELASIEQAIR